MTNKLYKIYGKIVFSNKNSFFNSSISKILKLIILITNKLESRLQLNFLNNSLIDDRIIVSLTSISPRIKNLRYVIESILRQSVRPKKIELWLSIKDFPNKFFDLPNSLVKLTKYNLQINFIAEDIGPHKKYFYSMKSNSKSIIVTIDDDVIYPDKMIESLIMSYNQNNDSIHCNISRIIDFNKPYNTWGRNRKSGCGNSIIPIGVGGVLYPENTLIKETFSKSKFMELCPYGDDLWLRFMAAKSGTKICQTKLFSPLITLPGSQKIALHRTNINERRNDTYIKNLIDFMGQDVISGNQFK